MRGTSLLRRPWRPLTVCSSCARRVSLSVSQRRLRNFSSGSHFAAGADVQALESRTLWKRPKQREERQTYELPDTPCRTRFAPSPTGYLHLGSLRTALFNYLVAKATGGQFVLRIEDTDQSRLVPDAEQRLYEDLRWAGLSWEEGPDVQGPYGPYRQSERLALYTEHADKLLREGKAYRCFCSPEALEEHKRVAHARGESTRYPGTCRAISSEESDERAANGQEFAIRFKSAAEPTTVRDIVYGNYRKKEAEDDYIIMKRDGFPTYHFANVVDDRHMKITHVIRGAEWLISTPKHAELYHAFGWGPPKFAHLGLLVDEQRQKLSKRHAVADMGWYKDRHVLPDALLNFAVLLGWRGVEKKKTLGLQDIIDNFSLKFTKGDIVVPMTSLDYLQNQHLRRLCEDDTPKSKALFESHVLNPLKRAIKLFESARTSGDGTTPDGTIVPPFGERFATVPLLEDERFRPDLVESVLSAKAENNQTPDLAARFPVAVSHLKAFIWKIPHDVLKASLAQLAADTITLHGAPARLDQVMSHVIENLASVEDDAWVVDRLSQELQRMEEPGEGKAHMLLKILRRALLASPNGMPVGRAMVILGKDETLRRLEAARLAAEETAVPAGRAVPA